jgi:hypothetical protein
MLVPEKALLGSSLQKKTSNDKMVLPDLLGRYESLKENSKT